MRSALRNVFRATLVMTLHCLSVVAFAHGGTTSRVPLEICAERELGDACQWDNGHGALSIGTCRGAAPSLRCVRNQPMVTVPSTEEHTHPHGPHASASEHEHSPTYAAPWFVFALAAGGVGLTWKRLGRRPM